MEEYGELDIKGMEFNRGIFTVEDLIKHIGNMCRLNINSYNLMKGAI